MLNQAGSGGFPRSNKVAIFLFIIIFKVQLALCSQRFRIRRFNELWIKNIWKKISESSKSKTGIFHVLSTVLNPHE